jgi:predicted HicB family RNase H-like nuclease
MNNTLEYKSYIGTVEYSAEDRIFFGKLAFVTDLVSFEADNVKDLEKNFQEAVDDYLETCHQLKKPPKKTFKGVFNIRIKPKLHKQAYISALNKKISLNKFVEESMEKCLFS